MWIENPWTSVRFRSRPPSKHALQTDIQYTPSFEGPSPRRFGLRIGLLALTLLLAGAALAELGPGDPLPEVSLQDQHGATHTIGADTRLLLFAADRPASDLINGYLKAQPGDFLSSRQAAYVADVSTMPGLITRLVALPRMRERPYRILLVDDATRVAFLPRRAGMVTLIHLDAGTVANVRFLSDAEQLAAALQPDA
jgi:hypothetical protein